MTLAHTLLKKTQNNVVRDITIKGMEVVNVHECHL